MCRIGSTPFQNKSRTLTALARKFVVNSQARKNPTVKPLFHSLQKPTRKLAASAFKYYDWMKVLAASLRVGFCDEWKRALNPQEKFDGKFWRACTCSRSVPLYFSLRFSYLFSPFCTKSIKCVALCVLDTYIGKCFANEVAFELINQAILHVEFQCKRHSTISCRVVFVFAELHSKLYTLYRVHWKYTTKKDQSNSALADRCLTSTKTS